MKEKYARISAPPQNEVRLEPPIGRGTRAFLIFLVCSAVLIAGFAVSRIPFPRRNAKEIPPSGTTDEGKASESDAPVSADTAPEAESLPEGATVIRTADLSGGKIRNETPYSINLSSLPLSGSIKTREFRADLPVVLILHTHAQESYRADDAPPYFEGTVGDAVYSEDPSKNVVAAGATLSRELNRNGIPTVHCTALHGEGGSLRGAYRSASECIRAYLERYPSIEYVIDLHRDGISDADGACLRTATPDGRAQIMAVVGTDGNGTDCPAWQANLGLALLLSDRLNGEVPGSCRAVSLRNASYNQEFARHSLLLEIGSSGNTVSEAIEAAGRVGKALAELIGGRAED